MSESCNSRHFSWLMKSCFPNPSKSLSPIIPAAIAAATTTTIAFLPDDLLLECLSRLPTSCLPSVSVVCRRWFLLLHSPSFLYLRRLRHLLLPTVFALSSSSSLLLSASLSFPPHTSSLQYLSWKVSPSSSSSSLFDNLSHARLSALGPRIFIIGRSEVFCYDTWTGVVSSKSPMIFPRKKFACAVVFGKIYVAGGGSRAAAAVEEYDPDTDSWRVVAQAPRRRYGCIGAAIGGVFYVIGGLKIGGGSANDSTRAAAVGAEAHVYASSMDLYDVKTCGWLRSRAVPGGGCVVAACAAAEQLYVLASHAVELSFWRYDARGQSNGGGGEWCRIKSPPLPAQVRLDGTVRFSCVGVENKVVLIQVIGSIDDLLRRSGRNARGLKEGLVLIYDCDGGEWSRGPDLPEVLRRAACASVEC